jgi:hypothetical protein
MKNDFIVHRRLAPIAMLEALLAVLFSLGFAAALKQPSMWWTVIVPVGLMAGFMVHHRSFVLGVSDGVLFYRELFRGTTRIPLAEIKEAHVECCRFNYRDRFKTPMRLVIIPKDSSSVGQFDINIYVFSDADIERLLQLIAK